MNEKNREHGAVIVEGIVSLTVFMFLMFSILQVINIAQAQARVKVATDEAAKEIAEYSHIYFITGAQNILTGTGGKTSEISGKIAGNKITAYIEDNEITDHMRKVADIFGANFLSDGADLIDTINQGAHSFEGDSVEGYLLNKAGGLLAQSFFNNHMKTEYGDVEKFKRKYHIKSFNFDDTYIFYGGDGSKVNSNVFVNVEYVIEVPALKFFNVEITYTLNACSYTTAWADESITIEE